MIVDGVKYKYISPHREGYRILKSVDGEQIYFGHFETLEEAIAYRDNLIEHDWDLSMQHRYAEYFHRSTDGAWQVDKNINGKEVHFGTYPSKKVAKKVVELLKDVNWDKNQLEKIIKENNIPTGRYTTKKFITKKKDYYCIVKSINDKKIHFGSFKTLEEALPIVEELKACGWDKSRVKEFREKYDVSFEDKGKRSKIFEYIVKINDRYVVQRFNDGKLVNYFSSRNLINALYERDALVNADWDYELWVEQEDHYTYISELLPEFNKRTSFTGLKYINRIELNNGVVYEVSALMKDLGKMKSVGRYNTLGEAQQVSIIVQKHGRIYEDIIDELQARNISYSKSFDDSMKYIRCNVNSWTVHKCLSSKDTTFGCFKTLDEAKTMRDKLVKVNWNITKLEVMKNG